MLHETMTSVVVSANLNSIPQLLCEAIDTGQYQRIYINTGAYQPQPVCNTAACTSGRTPLGIRGLRRKNSEHFVAS